MGALKAAVFLLLYLKSLLRVIARVSKGPEASCLGVGFRLGPEACLEGL